MKAILSCLLLLPLASFSQLTVKDLLQKTADTMQQRKSMNYLVSYTYKGSDRDDTLHFNGDVRMQKVKSDTLLGGMARVSPYGEDPKTSLSYKPGTYMFYDLKHAYKIFAATKTVVYQNPRLTRPSYMFDLYPEMMVWKPFLKPKQILEYNTAKYKAHLQNDTVINGAAHYKILIKHVNTKSEDWGNWFTILCLRKNDYTPAYREIWRQNGNKYQYESFLLIGYNYSDMDPSVYSATQLPADYEMKEIKPE